MTTASIGRIVAPYFALVAACGAAVAFGIINVRREPPVSTRDAASASAASLVTTGVRDEGSAELATAQVEANAAGAELSVSPNAPLTDEPTPVFDIARVERTGEAVIAGRAAPGATVELLRSGERLDQAVAGPSGHFVMLPSRLPPGDYELTLRSRLPDGTLATSKQGVMIALGQVEASSAAVQARQLSQPPPLHIEQGQDVAASQRLQATAAAPPPDEGAPSAVVGPKIATTVVSRGDSLWRISRVIYGAGMRYAVVYKANRDQIRDPNRIYPGQIFVLPMKTR